MKITVVWSLHEYQQRGSGAVLAETSREEICLPFPKGGKKSVKSAYLYAATWNVGGSGIGNYSGMEKA